MYALVITAIFWAIGWLFMRNLPPDSDGVIVVVILLGIPWAGCLAAFHKADQKKRSLRALEEIARNTRANRSLH